MGRASKELMANSLRESGGGRLEEDGLGTRVTESVNILGPGISLLNINGKMELYSESASTGPGEIQ